MMVSTVVVSLRGASSGFFAFPSTVSPGYAKTRLQGDLAATLAPEHLRQRRGVRGLLAAVGKRQPEKKKASRVLGRPTWKGAWVKMKPGIGPQIFWWILVLVFPFTVPFGYLFWTHPVCGGLEQEAKGKTIILGVYNKAPIYLGLKAKPQEITFHDGLSG